MWFQSRNRIAVGGRHRHDELRPPELRLHRYPQQPTLLKPVSRTFTVRAQELTLVFPGVPTATVWDVRINCDFIDVEATVGLDPPPPGSVATQMTY